MKKTILLLVSLCTFGVNAQDFSFGADVQSRYVWRGIQFGGESPSLQPGVEMTAGNFAVGAWGAYSLGGDNAAQELDLYVSYALTDAISVSVTDYYFPEGGSGHDYLELDSELTEHVYEATLSFAGTDAFPVALTVASNVGGDATGQTYLEASYAANDFSIFAGGVVGDEGDADDADGLYNTGGTGLINVGISLSKEIALSSTYSLPVNTSLVLNPDAGNVFLTFGFTL